MFEVERLVALAKDAGSEIMDVYNDEVEVHIKEDASPVTEADLRSHAVLVAGLNQIEPHLPILSEESGKEAMRQRCEWSRYWLLDPLDGTKEFIKRNGEFTVNIALIDQGLPMLGVVHAPALGVTYWALTGQGAWKEDVDGVIRPIGVCTEGERDTWRIVGSRSHQSEAFTDFVSVFSKVELVAMGSSLKLCLVAEGVADIYPRLGLTSEWDTAAAQAVVEAAGGSVLDVSGLRPLTYNMRPDTMLNPHFIVCASVNKLWADQLAS